MNNKQIYSNLNIYEYNNLFLTIYAHAIYYIYLAFSYGWFSAF